MKLVKGIRPETERSIHEQGEALVNSLVEARTSVCCNKLG